MPSIQLHICATFSAAHAIVIQGTLEPLHGHDWNVTIIVSGTTLDDDGLLCDFHALERHLNAIVQPFHNRSLNDTPPFDHINPTAEHVAMVIGDAMSNRLPDGVTLVSASVTEAPGCMAVYLPDESMDAS